MYDLAILLVGARSASNSARLGSAVVARARRRAQTVDVFKCIHSLYMCSERGRGGGGGEREEERERAAYDGLCTRQVHGLRPTVLGWDQQSWLGPGGSPRPWTFHLGAKIVLPLHYLQACGYSNDTLVVFTDHDVVFQVCCKDNVHICL